MLRLSDGSKLLWVACEQGSLGNWCYSECMSDPYLGCLVKDNQVPWGSFPEGLKRGNRPRRGKRRDPGAPKNVRRL
jgi:hypothetical protein